MYLYTPFNISQIQLREGWVAKMQECLPDILKKFNPRVKIPKKISDLIRKIEQKFEKANKQSFSPFCSLADDT
jgi:hypothetical protein